MVIREFIKFPKSVVRSQSTKDYKDYEVKQFIKKQKRFKTFKFNFRYVF